MEIDPRERLVDIYNEMRALDAEHFEYLRAFFNDEPSTTWLLVTLNVKFQELIQEAQQLRYELKLD